jgi:8-oxo-dGTP diphosphatase
MDPEIVKIYGNRLRTRVCGICWNADGALLMVNHKMDVNRHFWAPPGGGLEYGYTAAEALIREFKEETGLSIKVGKLLFTCEVLKQPIHAIELFFEINNATGKVQPGIDPEMSLEKQIIEDARFMPFTEIMMLPEQERHGIFNLAQSAAEFNNLSGYIKI